MQILIDTSKPFEEVITQVNRVLAEVAITTNEAAQVSGTTVDNIRHNWPDKFSNARVLRNRVYSRREVEGE